MKKLFTLLGVICLVVVGVLAVQAYQHYGDDVRINNRYNGEIAQVHSSVDQDGDGIDDQVDILQGALDYVATRPQYKSAYYAGGYPDDGYGVCTDVVAQAMLAAGYDLMSLVSADIAAHPEDYDIETPDANIDFRRVTNLNVYFSHTATSLSTELSDFEDWQGGDIVVFENHIGIVSDRRNAMGIPYVIHHYRPMQKKYEQDILGGRSDIVAHYRVSV